MVYPVSRKKVFLETKNIFALYDNDSYKFPSSNETFQRNDSLISKAQPSKAAKYFRNGNFEVTASHEWVLNDTEMKREKKLHIAKYFRTFSVHS